MAVRSPAEVEARTQEIGRDLYARLKGYKPSMAERLQDWLMVRLMEDRHFQNHLLRFVDVLAALPRERHSQRTAAIFREYFQGSFPHLPLVMRLGLSLARSNAMPDGLLAWWARRATLLLANRFIVEPGAQSVNRALEVLQRHSRYPSFDLLGETVVSDAEAHQYKQGYLDLVERLGQHPLAGQRTRAGGPCLEVSLKLSGLTPRFNPADPDGTLRQVRPALEEVCAAARERGIGVTVDAEQFSTRDLTWYVFRSVTARGEPLGQWQDIGLVVQAYLRDVEEHVREVLSFAEARGTPFRVRLVKGAYWDQEAIVAAQNGWQAPVFRDKAATDLSFERIVRQLLESPTPVHLAIGSHNIRSHAYAEAVREALGLPEATLEHQTLYRTLESLSRALPQMGWVTRDYVPSGDLIPGMAYLVRRVLENTSQSGFLTKSRIEEDVSDLLRVPELGQEDVTHDSPPYPMGFANTPAARLFDPEERTRFVEALRSTRERWGRTYPLYLGEEVVETAHVRPSLSPSHPDPSHPVAWVHFAGVDEAEQSVAVANRAAPAWVARPLTERVAIGLRAAQLLRDRKNEIAAWIVHEGGRSWSESLADIEEAIDHVEWNARELRRQTETIQEAYRPRGVVACIPPWNFPSALAAGMMSAAVLAGNAVILKSAGQTPLIAQLLVDAFHDAGVPKEALIHLPGEGRTVGAYLVESRDVDMVAFTGSKEVGTGIYRKVADVAPAKGGVKRAVTEMGGKNAIVVFPDADMDEAVLGILHSAFGHAGQKCSACSRVFVHREVYERLKERLVEAARSLRVGPADAPDTDINPMISEEARDQVLRYRLHAPRESRILLDLLDQREHEGWCLGPLLLEVDARRAWAATATQEELFGPVLPLITFESEEEAVSLVNDTVYGLTLGIFSRSPGTVRRMVSACQAGNIYVNRGITGARVGIEPFGGLKLSGTGPKTGSEEYALAFLTRASGYRQDGAAPSEERRAGQPGASALLQGLQSWESAAAEERVQKLSKGVGLLGQDLSLLEDAIVLWKPYLPGETQGAARDLLAALSRVIASAHEVTGPQPTVQVPGQDSFVTWAPRGLGLVAVDEGSDPETLGGLVLGGLLTGNGLVVVTERDPHGFAQMLVEALWRAGVPREVLVLAPGGASWGELAAGPLHFAAVDLSEGKTRSLDRILSVTKEEQGQRWLKTLISMSEGPVPGEPGFLRLFAHPKAVAVRTLRHGADLELV